LAISSQNPIFSQKKIWGSLKSPKKKSEILRTYLEIPEIPEIPKIRFFLIPEISFFFQSSCNSLKKFKIPYKFLSACDKFQKNKNNFSTKCWENE
jgi:hypothetical protein